MRNALAVVLLLALPAAAQTKDSREPRMIPLGRMAEDVEILYGDPEAVGEPFVMRIRELPGGVIPRNLDSPDAATIFTFRKGELVTGARGRGRINGGLYMAFPEEIRRVVEKE